MKNADKFFNYINVKNNAKIAFHTSQSNICYCSNILSDNMKVISYLIYNFILLYQSIWLSQPGFPQVIIIDISDLKSYPKKGLNTFGIYCWHAYNTNPKLIELLISTNYNSTNKNNNFNSLGVFELELRDGLQLFKMDYNVLGDEKIKNKIKAIKLVIKSSFGGNKTYINQVMFYENTVQEIKAHDTIQSSNTFQKEMNFPEDLTNSQYSLEENSQQINNENNININNNIKKIKNNKNSKNKENNEINGNKIKKHNIVDFISETNSKNSDRNNFKKDKEQDIKIEENNNIYNGNTSKNNKEEENENINNDNEEENKIISTSEGFQNSYMDIKSTSQKNEDEFFEQNDDNSNIKKNMNYNNKKVQKLEKILKQKILKNDTHINKKINNDEFYFNNFNNQNRTQDYNMNNNLNNFPNFTPIVKNNDYNYNNRNMDNQSNMSERESNFENEENIYNNNPIQKYFQINANTPGRFPINGYDYLMNKRRPTTPTINEIYLNQNQKKLRNKTLQNFSKNNFNKTDINNNKAYETLEYQLNDMEQHLQKMALNSDMLLPNNNISNYNTSKTNREHNYLDNNINNRKQNNNNSLISNTTSYMKEERNNIYNNSINNNNNYFTNYKNNNESQYANNTYYRDREMNESREINERIDNLEKNIFEIKNELNNISSGIKLFLDKDYFLYNFKDSIKQICYDFFSEKIDNNENNEDINQTKNEKEDNEEQNNSQYNNTELSESKNNNLNINNDINNANEKKGIEDRINKKIDEKLEYLCDNLKNQIYEKYLQPSINEIENSMKQNIEDIKKKVDSMNYSNDNNTNEINGEEINYSNNNEIILDKRNNQRKKYEEINRLGERLYNKLMEKEKKLKLLKQETTKLLNGKSMENDISNQFNY